jgi:hypothetical protein
MLSDIKELIDPDNKWEKLHRRGMIEFVRIVKEKITIETRYYISSLPNNALSSWWISPQPLGD